MGCYVHLQVSWAGGGTKEEVQELAKRWHGKSWKGCPEARWFFEDVVSGKSYFSGPKGTLWAWGTVGNYSDPDEFIKVTKEFFDEMYKANYLFEHDRVIFFCEPEQNESVQIYQRSSDGNVNCFSSDGAWYWGQY